MSARSGALVATALSAEYCPALKNGGHDDVFDDAADDAAGAAGRLPPLPVGSGGGVFVSTARMFLW